MRTFMIFIVVTYLFTFPGFSQSDFLQMVNGGGDGSNIQQAVTLRNECDFSSCSDQACLQQVWRDTVTRQQMDYLTNKYGQKGADWTLVRVTSVTNGGPGRGTFYENVVIRVVGEDVTTVLFNITSSVLALQDATEKLWRK